MDTFSRALVSKLEISKAILLKATQASLYKGSGLDDLQGIEVRFALITSRLFLKCDQTNQVGVFTQELSRVISTEDLAGRIDRILGDCESQIQAAGVVIRKQGDAKLEGVQPKPSAETKKKGGGGRPHICADIQRLFDMYMPGLVVTVAPNIDYNFCVNCSTEMLVDASRSELQCATCGAIRKLIGTVFDDSQFYSQEGQKAKSGTFNPNRHFQFWWMHILAREPEEEIGDRADPKNMYGDRLIEQLRVIIARDQHILQLLTVNDMRMMLRELGQTDLNKNVPLILKKLTGVGPPHILDTIAIRVENLFTKALETSEVVRQKTRVNRNYYPYYIYKILEQVIPEADFEQRRILFYIYIQSRETVESDDADWELICKEMSELKYIPTDRTKALQYMIK